MDRRAIDWKQSARHAALLAKEFRTERNHMRDFLDCIKSRRPTIAPVEAGHRSASIGHLSTIACMLDAKLEWDEKLEHFTNNDMANRMLSRPNRGDWSLT